MRKLRGLPAQLESYLHRCSGWVSKGTLTADMVWKHLNGRCAGARYLPETVGRALRSLEELKMIAVKADGISVAYKWLPSELRWRYIPTSNRLNNAKDKLFIGNEDPI